jgi:hypothetical protein
MVMPMAIIVTPSDIIADFTFLRSWAGFSR